MANLILPRRFTQQPQYPVEIDHNNPLTSGLVLTFSGAVLHDGVTGNMLTVTGSPRQEPRDGAVSLYTSASADVLSLAIPAIATSEPVTVVSRSSCSVYNSTRKRVWRAAGASYGTQLAEDYSTGSLSVRSLIRQTSTGSYQDATLSSGAIDANSWYDSKCSHSGGTAPSVMDIGWTSGSSPSGNRREAITSFFIGNSSSGLPFLGWIPYLYLYRRLVEDAEWEEIRRNPWQIFRRSPQVLYFDTAGGGATTGTGSLTTGATTASGTGTISHTGTGSLTTGATTLSGTGTLTHTGTGALTTLAATLAGAGVVAHFGTGDLTIAAVTVAGEGTVTQAGAVTGTGALTISAITASGTGVIAHTGTGSLQTSVVTLDGAGVLTHTGTGDLTTGATTLAGEGSTLGTITGTGALTIGAAQVSGYDVIASVTGGGIGHGGMAKRRPRLIRIEEAENPEEVIAEIEAAVAESVKKPGRKPKTITVVEKPIVEPSIQPNQWIDYYEQQAQRTREQDQLNDLIAKAKLKIQQLQAEDTFRRIQEYEARMREEEELMLLLMAA